MQSCYRMHIRIIATTDELVRFQRNRACRRRASPLRTAERGGRGCNGGEGLKQSRDSAFHLGLLLAVWVDGLEADHPVDPHVPVTICCATGPHGVDCPALF